MATVHVTLNTVQARTLTGASIPVSDSQTVASATATSTGSSATIPGISGVAGKIWRIVSTGDIWVAFGTNPTAAAGAGHLVPAGVPFDLAVTAEGEEIAVKDAV